MNNPEKTLWRKNIDTNFISGEDMHLSINGMKSEMNVKIVRFHDTETFDQNKQVKKVVTGMWLMCDGKEIYKPVVLNKTNAKFLVKEFGSEYIDDWVGKPFTIYAQKDSRHGYVVRFRKFVKPELEASGKVFDACRKAVLADPTTIEKVKAKYVVSPAVEAALMAKEEEGAK